MTIQKSVHPTCPAIVANFEIRNSGDLSNEETPMSNCSQSHIRTSSPETAGYAGDGEIILSSHQLNMTHSVSNNVLQNPEAAAQIALDGSPQNQNQEAGKLRVEKPSVAGHPVEHLFDHEPFDCSEGSRLNLNNFGRSKEKKKHPMQNIILGKKGIARFQENAIVVYLLDNGGMDMNDLAMLNFSDEDRMQFAQLIGYSVCGYRSLSYVSGRSGKKAAKIAEALEADAE